MQRVRTTDLRGRLSPAPPGRDGSWPKSVCYIFRAPPGFRALEMEAEGTPNVEQKG